MSNEAVRRVFEKNLAELQKCSNRNDLGKRLILQLVVGPNGKVQKVKFVGNEPNGGSAAQCIIAKIKGWQFPAIEDGKEVTVTLSVVFGPKETAKR